MIRVLVVDDLKLICRGLKAMFVSEEDIDIIGFAHDGKEAVKYVVEQKPDVVLIDVLMPVMGGIEATKEITAKFPEIKVIVLSTFEDDPIILDAIAAGAKGYLLKNMVAEDLARAIRSVYRGSSQFAPGIIDSLAKTAIKGSNPPESKVATQKVKANSVKANSVKAKPVASQKGKKKLKKEQPLFQYGDWLTVILGVCVLSQTDGMGHHMGHAGLFCLMAALMARSIRFWWDAPLKHRRTIGIFAFAATVGHAIYASSRVLDFDTQMFLSMSPLHQWGIWAGVISLILMTPAAVTSFKFFQKKLGQKWRQIHLLTVPSLALAVLHTVLIGPHYLLEFNTIALDYIRTYAVVIVGILVLLMRRQFFWSVLGLNKMGKRNSKNLVKNKQKLAKS